MADLLDKVITLGIGLEKKATEAIGELEKLGSKAISDEEAKEKDGGGEGLGAKKELENKLVDHGVKAISEFVALLNDCKAKAESGVRDSGEKVLDKLHMATKEEVEVALEMARVAREKVDELEKRVAALEKKKAPAKKKAAPKAAKSE
jgi:BMFP domain-containing protein YqiC